MAISWGFGYPSQMTSRIPGAGNIHMAPSMCFRMFQALFSEARIRISRAGSLNMACRVIGVFGIISSLGLMNFGPAEKQQEDDDQKQENASSTDTTASLTLRPNDPIVEVLRNFMFLAKGLGVLLNGALVHAALKRRRDICLIWIAWTGIETGLYFTACICVISMKRTQNMNNMLVFGGYSLYLCLQWFFTTVVKLYVYELDDELTLQCVQEAVDDEMPRSGPSRSNGFYEAEQTSYFDPPPPYPIFLESQLQLKTGGPRPPPPYRSLEPQPPVIRISEDVSMNA